MRYIFDDCVLDTGRRELRRSGGLVAVEPQVFDLLVYLIQNRERVVSKDDLIASVWHGRIVSESAMGARINAARAALGDSGEAQRLIKTLHRRGHRFVAAVQEEPAAGAATFPTDPAPPEPPLREGPSLAVLPFTNMSDDPDQAHFADGITEDLITDLARIRWLFVIARNSSFVYKHRAVDVTQVSRELGVRYVLEGSVRRTGARLRISAQLIDAATGGHRWAERYDRELGDIFAVQDEITSSVAATIEPELMAAEGTRAFSRSSDDLSAWELVARAQAHFWRMTRPDHEAAVTILERAVETFPNYARAKSLLGFRLVFGAHMGWVDRNQGLLVGGRLATRAVALDDRDPWGHIALGYWAMMEKRTDEAVSAFLRALSINPNSAAGHGYLSHVFAFAGRDREAIEHAELAMRLSPLDPETAFILGGIAVAHYTGGRFAEAAHYAAEALRLRPGFQGAQRLRCASLAQAGRIEEARALLAAVLREQPLLSIDWVRASVPYQTDELMERFVEGLRKAGLTGN